MATPSAELKAKQEELKNIVAASGLARIAAEARAAELEKSSVAVTADIQRCAGVIAGRGLRADWRGMTSSDAFVSIVCILVLIVVLRFSNR